MTLWNGPVERTLRRIKIPFESADGQEIMRLEQVNRPFCGLAVVPYRDSEWTVISVSIPGDITLQEVIYR